MTKSINPYKPIVDSKFIIEQAENKNMSVWEFLKGFVVDGVSVKEESEGSGDDEYDWQDMAMEELIDGIQYVMIENGRLRRENETLRKDNALLYDQNDRLQMANRGIMVGVRRVVEGQMDLF